MNKFNVSDVDTNYDPTLQIMCSNEHNAMLINERPS